MNKKAYVSVSILDKKVWIQRNNRPMNMKMIKSLPEKVSHAKENGYHVTESSWKRIWHLLEALRRADVEVEMKMAGLYWVEPTGIIWMEYEK